MLAAIAEIVVLCCEDFSQGLEAKEEEAVRLLDDANAVSFAQASEIGVLASGSRRARSPQRHHSLEVAPAGDPEIPGGA